MSAVDGDRRESRFPGFDVLAQRAHWDDATRAVVIGRTVEAPPVRFFTPHEEALARALTARLLDLPSRPDRGMPDVVRMIDGRLAEMLTDGWHYDTMPPDDQAWRRSLHALDDDARAGHGVGFADGPVAVQSAVLSDVQRHQGDWHGMEAVRVWSLWTRYTATAYYSHPTAWNEIGFSGPAYPRGYKNLGVDRREPWEMRDALPTEDPERES